MGIMGLMHSYSNRLLLSLLHRRARPLCHRRLSLVLLLSRAGWGGGGAAAAVAAEGDVVSIVGATRRQHLHGVHPGPLSTTRGQGASPCGLSRLPVVSLTRRWPCSLVLHLPAPTPLLRGLHLLAPKLANWIRGPTLEGWLYSSHTWASWA